MSKHFYSDLKIGILGGGQLGRMLIQEAINYNLDISILDPDANAPCKNYCSLFVNGSLNDFDTVYNFGKDLDLITIEIENVNVEALEKLEAEGKKVFPQPSVIKTIRDKGLQKMFYKKHGLPTAEFYLVDKKEDIAAYGHLFPLIKKMRTEGYDGKGVTKLTDRNNLEKAFTTPSILETCVDFKKEISVIVARNEKGECKTFPMVDMEFNSEANLVEFLYSPSDFDEDIANRASHIAIDTAKAFGIVGILAVEMFVTQNDDILINECAPRPHNSGHHTIEANVVSQYEQHLRAILNLPLASTDIIEPAVMINLLGEKGYEGDVFIEGMEEAMNINGVYIHLYGKKKTKPFRKMGHVTICDESMMIAKQKAKKVMAILKVKSL